MAGRLAVDLYCSICCEIFKDPVVLKCSHSFCKSCLQQYWCRRGVNRDCPLCRKQSVDEPVPSLTLRNLCESYALHKSEEQQEEEDLSEPLSELDQATEMCLLHGERLKLYCLVDKEPICVVCHTSKKHKWHDCCPVSEAVAEVKEKMASAVSLLQEKRNTFDQMRKSYEDNMAHIQFQARFVERRTREEFERLHNFLQAEEEVRMEALRGEEEQKCAEIRQKLEEMERKMASVSTSIKALEEEMELENIPLLCRCQDTPTRTESEGEDSAMDPVSLISVAEHVGSLAFNVWKKMRTIIKYTPVILDPNTAAPWLVLSDDLTSVCDSDQKQQLPDNPERFNPDTAVLGHVGFTSGKYAWDVNVGENTAWVVGVAKESVKRKEKVSSVLMNGFLCMYFYHQMYFAGTSPLTRLAVKSNPQKIRVLLDCDKGRVSFYNTHDNAHIYTFKHAITEKVFPYFWVGCQKFPLAVDPQEVSVMAVEYC
ncbi:nuclear factor 7, brain-like [Solea solea]|uniref:nuclear factor 7, brain-like n=1 Tax=Solea solea TaxID=90069 RepID=UPI00272B4A57|nr:nuclear factor 7, brain-like [Solea solea]